MKLGGTVTDSVQVNANTMTFYSKSTKISRWPLVLLYRLLLLGIGGGLAWFLGMVIANFYPNPNPQMPLVLQLLGSKETNSKNNGASRSRVSSVLAASPTPQMPPQKRQQLQTQLQQLQTQMKALSDRTTEIERQFGRPRPTEVLETRLQDISEQLQAASLPANPNDNTNRRAGGQGMLQTSVLKVTLPSEVLFQDNYSILRSEASLILDKVVGDLNYPKATIIIGAHTNDVGQAEDNRELSYRRARAIEQYLSRTLGDRYQWVVVGYGASRPLVENNSSLNRQRNQRIEITIDPNND